MGLLALLQKDNTFFTPCLSLAVQECATSFSAA